MLHFNKNKSYEDIKNRFRAKTSQELLEYLTLSYQTFDLDYAQNQEVALTEYWQRKIILEVLHEKNEWHGFQWS